MATTNTGPRFGPDAPARPSARDMVPGLPGEGSAREADRRRQERAELELRARELRPGRPAAPAARTGPDPSDPADARRWAEARRWADALHQQSVDRSVKSDAVLVAHHEASHAGAAWALGARVLGVSVVETHQERGYADYDVTSLPAGPDRRYFEAVVSLAGAHGERLSPTWRAGYADHRGGRSDRELALRAVRDESLLSALDSYAAELVEENQAAIRALADALVSGGTLTGPEAEAILKAGAREKPTPAVAPPGTPLDAMTLEQLGKHAWRRLEQDAPESEFTAILAAIDRKRSRETPGRGASSVPPWERRPTRRGVEERG